jgi:hypothetical protein
MVHIFVIVKRGDIVCCGSVLQSHEVTAFKIGHRYDYYKFAQTDKPTDGKTDC